MDTMDQNVICFKICILKHHSITLPLKIGLLLTTEECSLNKNAIKKKKDFYVTKILSRSGNCRLCKGFGSFSRLHVIVVLQLRNINTRVL